MSISTGLTAPQDSDISCDRANEVGVKIQQSLDNQTYTSAKVPSTLKIDNDVVDLDPLILFSRLIL